MDVDIDEDGLVQVDEFGDIQTVFGNENVRQQHRLAVGKALADVDTNAVTQESKRNIRRTVRDTLSSLSYVDEIVAVKLFILNDETVRIDVQTQSDDLTFRI